MNDILQSVTHGYNDSEVESISSSSTDSEDSDYVHAMDESESDESLEYLSSDMSDTDTNESSLSDHEMETSCSTSLLAATDVPSSASVPLLETKTSLPFKLVGDNIDKNVRPRYLRSSIHRTESLHYFHSYAVRDRIGFNELPHKQPSSCLPSKHT